MSIYAFLTAIWQGLLASVMALGIFVSFRIVKFPDLTCDGSYPLGASIAVVLILKGVDPYISTALALFAGCLAGTITGLLNTKCKIPAIISSILVMSSLFSVNLLVMGKPILSIRKEDTIFATLYSIQDLLPAQFAGVNSNLLILPVIFLAISFLLKIALDRFLGSRLGVALRITGANPRLANSLTINTNLTNTMGLAVANGLIALSGALFAQTQRFSDVNLGFGMVIVGLASVFIAEGIETQIPKRHTIALATTLVIVGSIIYKLAIALAYEAGLKTDYFNILTSTIVFLALLVPNIRNEISSLIRK
ncbi:MAG: ABC transporter permease [Syntrophorhabdaceae bacterium]